MCGLMLVRPCKLYAEQVMSYKEEMSQNGDSFDGCAGLEDVYSFDEWIDFDVVEAVPNESELTEKSLTAMHMSSNLL